MTREHVILQFTERNAITSPCSSFTVIILHDHLHCCEKLIYFVLKMRPLYSFFNKRLKSFLTRVLSLPIVLSLRARDVSVKTNSTMVQMIVKDDRGKAIA